MRMKQMCTKDEIRNFLETLGNQEQIKKLSGDLQTRDREAVNLRKRVEVEKFKGDLDKVSNKAQAANTLFEKRLDDNLSTVKTDIRRSIRDGSPSGGRTEAAKEKGKK